MRCSNPRLAFQLLHWGSIPVGVLHVDTTARDSLACDLMEPVRPHVDAYLLDWITRQPLRREWFFEQRDGNCRLMAPFAVQLSETARMWGRAVAPIAEWVARELWTPNRSDQPRRPPTRLTQRHKREARGASPLPPPISPPRQENLCGVCGKTIDRRSTHCSDCSIDGSTERLTSVAKLGRVAARSPEARAKHVASHLRHTKAISVLWPSWRRTTSSFNLKETY